jgi:hypothetical protein
MRTLNLRRWATNVTFFGKKNTFSGNIGKHQWWIDCGDYRWDSERVKTKLSM